MLRLRSLEYSEDSPSHWTVKWHGIGDLTMIVGVNSTGKSRLLSVIFSLARLVAGRTPIVTNGRFSAIFDGDGHTYKYELNIDNNSVDIETLDLDGRRVLNRLPGKPHTILTAVSGSDVLTEFGVSFDTLAIQAKRDSIQNPYLEPLIEWGANAELYAFTAEGSGMHVFLSPTTTFDFTAAKKANAQPFPLAGFFMEGRKNYGDDFTSFIEDKMTEVGFPVTNVSIGFQPNQANSSAALGMEVLEVGRTVPTAQFFMSSGMIRALSVLIKLRLAELGSVKGTLLLDDIGEGMDYDRSVKLIQILLTEAKRTNIQLFMTTNDRFVMNSVPLEHWAILRRIDGTVSVIDKNNQNGIFEKFTNLGLTNFDLFKSITSATK